MPLIEQAMALMNEALVLLDTAGVYHAAVKLDHALAILTAGQGYPGMPPTPNGRFAVSDAANRVH